MPIGSSDPLSALAPLLRVRRVEVQEICRFAAAWQSAHDAQRPAWAQFHIVTRGRAQVQLPGGQRCRLEAGSVLLIPAGTAHRVQSIGGTGNPQRPIRVAYEGAVRLKTNAPGRGDTELICGRLQFDRGSGLLMTTVLPAALVVNVQAQEPLGNMRLLLRLIARELKSARPGALAVAADLSSALFVLMLRLHFEHGADASASLRLLRSPVCARAVSAMATRPAQAWTLEALAAVALVSRATLVRAFRNAAGIAPLAFLAELRLTLAHQRLAGSRGPLLPVATAAGYASESAFVRAFSRRFGISPGKVRPAAR